MPLAKPACWCGNRALDPWSPEYFRCVECGTLVFARQPDVSPALVRNDAADLYGRTYWHERKTEIRKEPTIDERARLDLPERCAYWLRAVLRYRRPPARVLELGCAHGGFVALLRASGFDARGAELSPAIVEYAKSTFGVPVYLGPVEAIPESEGPFDVIASFDVIEHLPDPVSTISRCVRMLAPGGIFIAQTPFSLPEATFEELRAKDHPTLLHLIPDEHLFLYSERGAGILMERCGLTNVRWERPIFAHYDQFLFASAGPLAPVEDAEAEREYLEGGGSRIPLALMDAQRRDEERVWLLRESEADRAARLEAMHAKDAALEAQAEAIRGFERESPWRFAVRFLGRVRRRALGLGGSR